MQQVTPVSSPMKQQKFYVENEEEEEQQNMGNFHLVQKMVHHLKQQQLSPTLLPFQQELFLTLKKDLKQQQENLKQYKQLSNEDQTTNAQKNFKNIIYSMEIQKINFILKHYLRIRLNKIQQCSFYYFKNMSISDRIMSKSELEFLKKYVELRYKYYEKNIFKQLIKNFRGVGGMELFLNKPQEKQLVKTNQSNSQIIEPDVNSYVFLKMIRNRNEFRYVTDIPIKEVPKQESQIASSNDILFIPYGAAQSLIERSEQGDLILI